jgi:hypothetical protein
MSSDFPSNDSADFKLHNNKLFFCGFCFSARRKGVQPINVHPSHVKSTFFLPMYQTVWERYSHYKIRKNSNYGFDWQQFKSNFRV